MRKFTFLLGLLLAFVVQSQAGPVSLKKAKSIASKFIQIDEQDSFRASTVGKEEPAYYVFNGKDKHSFVIISGEDQLDLLLGYSDDTALDQNNLPKQLREMLENLETQVQYLRRHPRREQFRAKIFVHNPRIVKAPIVKALWNQDWPFDQYTPKVRVKNRDQSTATGCVATAMAQVMHYYKWPAQGKGNHTYKPTWLNQNVEQENAKIAEENQKLPDDQKKAFLPEVKLSADFSKSIYDWNNMNDVYVHEGASNVATGQWTWVNLNFGQAQLDAVAKLMYDLGVSLDMDYNIPANGGSGAFNNAIAASFNNYFDYKARYVLRENCRGDEYISLIKRELDADRPVIMCGASKGGGHCFVIDGYDENDYLHTNWGWDGQANGYFNVAFMNPSPDELGIGAGTGNYNGNQSITIAVPSDRAAQVEMPEERILNFWSTGGLEYISQDLLAKDDKNIRVRVTNLNNSTYMQVVGTAALGLFDKDGNLITLNGSHQVAFGPRNIEWLSETPLDMSQCQEGETYYVRSIYQLQGETEWRNTALGNTLELKVENGKVKIVKNKLMQFRLTEKPRFHGAVYQGQEAGIEIAFENLGNVSARLADIMMFCTNEKTGEMYRFFLSPFGLFLGAEAEIKNQYHFTPILPVGTYRIDFRLAFSANRPLVKDGVVQVNQQGYLMINNDFANEAIENPFGSFQLTVLDGKTLPMLECKDISIAQGNKLFEGCRVNTDNLDLGKIKLAVELQNVGSFDYEGAIAYKLKDVETDEMIELGKVEGLNIAKGEKVEMMATMVEADFSRIELKDKHTYLLTIVSEEGARATELWSSKMRPYYFMTEEGVEAHNLKVKEDDEAKAKAEADRLEAEKQAKEKLEQDALKKTELEKEIERLKKEMAQLLADKTQLEADKTKLDEKNAELDKEKARLEKEVLEKDLLEKDKAKLESEKQALEQEKTGLEKTKADLEAEKLRLDKEVERLQAEINRLEKEQSEKEKLQKEKEALEKEKQALEEEKKRLEEELAKKQTAVAGLEKEEVMIYPNPVQDVLKVVVPHLQTRLYSLNGQLIMTAGSADSLDLTKLEKGTYLLRVQTTAGEWKSLKLYKK